MPASLNSTRIGFAAIRYAIGCRMLVFCRRCVGLALNGFKYECILSLSLLLLLLLISVEFDLILLLLTSVVVWQDTLAMACGMSWAGLLLDTFVPFLLAYRPTRNLAFLATMMFHITNKLMLNIGKHQSQA
jgi:hypothetical protein